MPRTRPQGTSGTRWCSREHRFRQISDFNVDRSTGDGLSYVCRPCAIAALEMRRRTNGVHPQHRYGPPGKTAKLGERWCVGHAALHDDTEFGKNRTTADGRHYHCREFARAQLMQSRRARGVKPRWHPPVDATSSWCGRCRAVKPRGDFHVDSRKPRGVKSWCRPCMNAASENWKRRQGVLPKRRVGPAGTKWCNRCERFRSLGDFHVARVKRSGRRCYCRFCTAALNAVRRTAAHRFTAGDIFRQYRAQGGRCFYCGRRLRDMRFHVDHRIPISRGGSNKPENLACACARCNIAKGGLTEAEFLVRRAANGASRGGGRHGHPSFPSPKSPGRPGVGPSGGSGVGCRGGGTWPSRSVATTSSG